MAQHQGHRFFSGQSIPVSPFGFKQKLAPFGIASAVQLLIFMFFLGFGAHYG